MSLPQEGEHENPEEMGGEAKEEDTGDLGDSGDAHALKRKSGEVAGSDSPPAKRQCKPSTKYDSATYALPPSRSPKAGGPKALRAELEAQLKSIESTLSKITKMKEEAKGETPKDSTAIEPQVPPARRPDDAARGSATQVRKSPTGRPQRARRPPSQLMDNAGSTPPRPVRLNKQMRFCERVLRDLMQHRMGYIFGEPVDYEKMSLWDYPKIVKHPMDLGTIRKTLESGGYASPEEFASDVRLVWANALLYNPAGTPVVSMTNTLKSLFESKMKHLPPPEAAPAGRKELVGQISQLKGALAKMEKGEKKARSKPPREQKMTFEEKRDLSMAINQLPGPKLGKVVKIISARLPQLAQEQEDEIEIDIDALDAATLRHLERYVKSVLGPQSGGPKRYKKGKGRKHGSAAVPGGSGRAAGRDEESTESSSESSTGSSGSESSGSESLPHKPGEDVSAALRIIPNDEKVTTTTIAHPLSWEKFS